MTKWVALSRQQHADLAYMPRDSYQFASTHAVTEVGVAELPQLLSHYLLGIVSIEGQWQLAAVLGLQPGQNLYVRRDGSWIASYVPASLRRYPFRLGKAPNVDDLVLCLAEEALTEEPTAPALFDADELSDAVKAQLGFLQAFEKNATVTRQALHKLDEAGVIEPWPIRIPMSEGQRPLEAKGLYRINEQKLNELEADLFASLRGIPLAIAHAHFFSLAKLNPLIGLAKQQLENGVATPESLDGFFGEDDDDLTFDFDS